MNICYVKDCEELPTEELVVTAQTSIGERTEKVTLCDRHYQELTTGCTPISMGCITKEIE